MDVHIKADVSKIPAETMDQTVLKIEVPFVFDPASYISTSGNKLLRTTDRGSTWEKYDFDATLQFNCKSMFFSSYQHGFLCGSNGQFFETENAGESWFRISSENAITINNDINCIRFQKDNFYIMCGDNGLLLRKSSQAHQDWQNSVVTPSIPPNININYLCLVPNSSQDIYAVGDEGQFLKSTNQGANFTSSIISPHNLNSVYFQDEIYLGKQTC